MGRCTRFGVALCFQVSIMVLGCADQQQVANNPAPAARCDECHTYPGSVVCQTTKVADSAGVQHTSCVACHHLSVQSDSARIDTTLVYFDAMMAVGNETFPQTDTLHANGNRDLRFTQCHLCHSFPPSTGDHERHITTAQRKCIDCHLNSMQYKDTLFGTQHIFLQDSVPVFGGAYLPLVNATWHRNQQPDVVFRRREEMAGQPGNDTMLIWNPLEQTCANVSCHIPAFRPLTSWR